jgi:hypothetical protein
MRRALLSASMLILVSGCTVYGTYWAPPAGPEANFELSARNCENSSLTRFPPMTMGKPGYFRTPNEWCEPAGSGTNCTIIGAGYLPQARSAADTNIAPREHAFNACMVAGGWRPNTPPAWIYVPPAPAVTR